MKIPSKFALVVLLLALLQPVCFATVDDAFSAALAGAQPYIKQGFHIARGLLGRGSPRQDPEGHRPAAFQGHPILVLDGHRQRQRQNLRARLRRRGQPRRCRVHPGGNTSPPSTSPPRPPAPTTSSSKSRNRTTSAPTGRSRMGIGELLARSPLSVHMETNDGHKSEAKTTAIEKPRTPLVAFLIFMLFFVPFCLLIKHWARGDTGGVHNITGWRVDGPLIGPIPTLAFLPVSGVGCCCWISSGAFVTAASKRETTGTGSGRCGYR